LSFLSTIVQINSAFNNPAAAYMRNTLEAGYY